MRHAGMNMGQVKQSNRSNILKYVNECGPVSRKDIAEATGLTPAAVTQICTSFIEQGILEELGIDPRSSGKGAGRRKVLLQLNPDYCHIFGINIEVEQTTVALCDLTGKLLAHTQIETDRKSAPEVFLERIASECKVMYNSYPGVQDALLGACVAIRGIVDTDHGLSVHAYDIWDETVDVCHILERKLKIPVIIQNNVEAYAQAEILYGMGRQYDNLLLVKWGPGVGSTLIIHNQVYEGRHGKGAELGHFIVEKDGKPCVCGRKGCLETRVSYPVLAEKYPFKIEHFGGLYRMVHAAPPQGTADDGMGEDVDLLTGMSKEKRKELADLYDEAMDLFARSIVNSITILAPNRVLLYGKMFHDPMVRDKLIEECRAYDPTCDALRILPSPLADKEDYIGPVAAYVQTQIVNN